MAAWCLVPELANKFLDALKSGELSPEKLIDMTSAARREELAKYVGEENAHEVNAQFESKLLLEDQRRGLVNWAKKVGGITEPARRDLLNTISKMDRVLNPADEQSFLADLAAKKLGTEVTADEARNIFELSQKAEQLRQQIVDAGNGNYNAGYTDPTGIAYGRAAQALKSYLTDLKPNGKRDFMNGIENVAGLTRQMETGIMHFSAPGVQALGMVGTKPFWAGIYKMFQFFADPNFYDEYNAYMATHPNAELAKGGGLGLTKVGDIMSAREEEIQTSLLEQLNKFLVDKTGLDELVKGAPQPIKGMLAGNANLIKGFSRAFTGYLNYVRFERFNELISSARMRGEDMSAGSEAVHDIAQVVNNFTGRAEIGYRDAGGAAAAPLNTVLYTVRKNVATIQMFNPYEYVKPNMSPTARMAAVRQITGLGLFAGSVVGLAASVGIHVDMDPTSSDFMKVPISGYKVDILGANASYIRFVSRLVLNKTTFHGQATELGSKFGGPTRASVVLNYLRGKLAPNASIFTDALVGSDATHAAFSLPKETYDRFMPIWIRSTLDWYNSHPKGAEWALPAASMFGIGVESPAGQVPSSASGRDVWGDKMAWNGGAPKNWDADPVNQALKAIDYPLYPPQNTIRGVQLTPPQFDEYVHLSGSLAHMRMSELIQSPTWNSQSNAARTYMTKDVIRTTRDIAANTIMMEHRGEPNDILLKSQQAKAARLGISP